VVAGAEIGLRDFCFARGLRACTTHLTAVVIKDGGGGVEKVRRALLQRNLMGDGAKSLMPELIWVRFLAVGCHHHPSLSRLCC
jgi:hypothetical protein